MSGIVDESAKLLAPTGGGTAPRAPQTLSGTGTTEDHNATKLTNNAYGTMKVGATAVRASFRSATGGSTQVATTDIRFEANALVHWWVTDSETVVYVEAADGASAYEAWVWTSSHGLGTGLGS